MEPIKNEIELFSKMDSFLDENGRLKHEEFLKNHEEVSFFDECEDIPEGFEKFTVFCKTNRNGRGLFYFLKKKFDDFQTPENIFESLANFSENGKLNLEKFLEQNRKIDYYRYKEVDIGEFYDNQEQFIFFEMDPYGDKIGLFMLTHLGNFTPQK